MKKRLMILLAMCVAVMLLGGCGINSAENESEKQQEAEIGSRTEVVDALVENVTDDQTELTQEIAGEGGEEAVYDDGAKEKDESPATGYMIGEHERTYDGIKEYLSTLSEKAEEFAKAGGLAVNWDSVEGMRNLVAFEERYEAGEEAEIAVMQYTTEGDPVLDYLYYDGTEVWHVTDSSRDMWGVPEYAYTQDRYPYFLYFTQRAEEQDRMHTLVLSQKDDLTYDECTQMYFENGNGEKENTVRFIASFFYTDADMD